MPAYTYAIQQSRQALKRGDRLAARRWAEQAATLDPAREDPWLILAAVASPRASIEYLKRALEINPSSTRARRGMHWAVQRYRKEQPCRVIGDTLPTRAASAALLPVSSAQPAPMQPDRLGSRAYVWATLLALITVGLLWWNNPPASLQPDRLNYSVAAAQARAVKATFTATPTATLTPTPTFTPAPTNTPADTPTAAPAAAVTLLATATSLPSIPPAPTEDVPQVSLPPGAKRGEIWIDVDLTNQYLQVYKGKNLLNGFVVSTGTWQHPTVTGQYQIYVKYPAADMAGPGYYLPSVPYVMYFYKGYGIHGTYWHNNFGTPMSHGCINLRTADAEWVYNKASVGTLVNIHY